MHDLIIVGLMLAVAVCVWILFHIESEPVDNRKEIKYNHDYEG